MMDVKKYAPTAHLYDTYKDLTEVTQKLNSFQQADSKIDFENSSEDSIKRAK